MMKRWLIVCGWLLVVALIVRGDGWSLVSASAGSVTGGDDCPRPTPMTAPAVYHYEYTYHAPTYRHIRVWFVLHDQFGDFESPLYLYRAADQVWRTTAVPEQQPTVCQEQYRQFIEFSLGVLNEGERPFTYDNQESIADYEAFLLSKVEWRFYLPVIEY